MNLCCERGRERSLQRTLEKLLGMTDRRKKEKRSPRGMREREV